MGGPVPWLQPFPGALARRVVVPWSGSIRLDFNGEAAQPALESLQLPPPPAVFPGLWPGKLGRVHHRRALPMTALQETMGGLSWPPCPARPGRRGGRCGSRSPACSGSAPAVGHNSPRPGHRQRPGPDRRFLLNHEHPRPEQVNQARAVIQLRHLER